MVNTRVQLGQYMAWVVVEGQEVEHYDIEVNEENKVASCWIASTAGKRFGVKAIKTHTNFDCDTFVTVDGSYAGCNILEKETLRTSLCDSVFTGKQTRRPLLFGELNLTDDDTVLIDELSHTQLGEIKIKISRVIIVGEVQPSYFEVSEVNKVHERAKKAVTHKVSFGKEIIGTEINETVAETYPLETVATFIFRYRSLDMLKANGIVPHDPLPDRRPLISGFPNPTGASTSNIRRQNSSSLKREESVEEIGPDEEEYRKKEAELQAELKKLKRARLAHSQNKRPTKKMKRETKSVFLPGEVIDLTIE